METQQAETVVDKAVNFVKDMFGIHPETTPDAGAKPEYENTAPEVTAENAMRLDPNAYPRQGLEQLNAGSYVRPIGDTDAERLRREVGEAPREKSALELNAENARAEEGG